MNTRYTYLTTQRDDVEKAKGELARRDRQHHKRDDRHLQRTVRARSARASRRRFWSCSAAARRATLELEDENDVLTCGIEIKVQPPGKALKTITLLSGGEKAFVAIALYFAIMKVQPDAVLRHG